jgi:hypothetical protein
MGAVRSSLLSSTHPVDLCTYLFRFSLDYGLAASDDLGVPLLLADGKLFMVACGTKVKILDARQPHRGCRVRILEGEFFGKTAFAPRNHLQVQ